MPARRSSRARVIAIDGPAASGKSVAGSGAAEALGYRFFDTGAMYRAMTWRALSSRVALDDEDALASLAEGARIAVSEAAGDVERTHVIIDGEDATPHLRDADVEAAVSVVSRVPAVRRVLVHIQRELSHEGGVVMAGRDIGTVVLPDADLKVYLEASARIRAERRAAQMLESGVAVNVEQLAADLARRDAIDSGRATSPLTPAHDAVIINTDDMSIEDVIVRIVGLAQ